MSASGPSGPLVFLTFFFSRFHFFFLQFFFLYIFFFHFFSFLRHSEKGTGLSQNSEPAKTGFGPVLSPNLLNQGSALSFLRIPNLTGFGERSYWPFSELWTGVRSSSYYEHARVWSSEKGTDLSPNQGYTRSFFELRTRVIPILSPKLKLRTPGKNTILDHLVITVLR